MSFFIKSLVLLSFFIPFAGYSANSKPHTKNKSKLTYQRYPMIPHGKKFAYPSQIKVAGENLKIKIHPKMGTHIMLGIDQLYVSKNLKKKVLVKQDVIPSSKKVIGQWTKLSSGSVYHYVKNEKIIAVYAEGYHERALNEIERQFVSLKSRKVGHSNLSPFMQLLFTCAYAEIGSSGWSENFDWQGTEAPAPVGAVDNAPSTPSTEVGSPGESLARCLLRQTGSSLSDMGQSATDTVTTAARAVWDDPMGAARATGNYLYGAGESAVNGVYNAGSAVVNYCLENCLDVDQMWSDAGNAVDSMYQMGEQLVSRVSGAVEGFQNLAPAVKNRLICEMGGQMIAEFGVGAVLSFLGGAAVAAPRVALMLNNLEDKIGRGMAALSALGQANIPVDVQQEYVTNFMRGNMSEADIIAVINGLPGNNNSEPRFAAAGVNPSGGDSELPTGAAASALAGGRTLESIEDIYTNQQVTVTSLSGNTYSGEFVEFVNDSRAGEMTMVLRNSEGQLDSYRVSRLDLNSITGNQNNFLVGSGGALRPVAGTPLGAQMESFQTRSGLSFKAGTGDTNGTGGFHVDIEAGTVTLDQAVLNDPVRMSSLMSTTLPQVIRTERQVRSNLRDNHGVTVGTGGVLQATSPTSTLGRMVAGLERQGVRVSITDPNIRSMGAGGIAYGGRYITLDSEMMLPGRETALMGVLRHEVRHTTTVRGATRYPVVDPSNPTLPPSAAALTYAGRNIEVISESGDAASGLTGSGLHEIYASRFRADEYDARLTQFSRNNPAIPASQLRGGRADDSRGFLQSQGEILYQIQRNQLEPVAVQSYAGNTTIVTYRVNRNGSDYLVNIPLEGPMVKGQAPNLAMQVVDSRVRYLSQQHELRMREGTFRQPQSPSQ